MNDYRNSQQWRKVLALTAALALSALSGCGGDGSSAPPPPPPPPPPTPTLSVSGTAATGTAIVGGAVAVHCASGTGTATTAADGTYSVTISAGTLPCVLRVTSTSGLVLHSVATGSGTSVVANITPVTQLVVADMTGLSPAAFYAAFDATKITTATVAAAEAAVVALLQQAGINFGALGDLISGSLTAGTGATAGNAYDTALDSLATALTQSHTTLDTLTAAVVVASGGGSSGNEAASVPANLLLQPAASNCSALRSATYRIVSPLPGGPLASQFGLATIDASTLAIVRPDGSTGTLVANGSCRFSDTDTASGYSADIAVTQADVLVARYTRSGIVRNFIGFPEQAHALTELAGNWNIAGMNPAGATDVAVTGAATLDGAGTWSAVSNCENDTTWAVSTCADVPSTITALLAAWTVDGSGGFDVPDAGTGDVHTRVFAYRAGGGMLMLATVSQTGFGIWSPVHAITLPTAGVSTTSWNFDVNPDLTSNTATYETVNAVDTVDATARTWTRTHSTIGNPVSRVETLFADNPRTGYVFRAASTVTGSDGVTQVNIREFTLLRVTGMGLSVGTLPQLKLFEWSPVEP